MLLFENGRSNHQLILASFFGSLSVLKEEVLRPEARFVDVLFCFAVSGSEVRFIASNSELKLFFEVMFEKAIQCVFILHALFNSIFEVWPL